KAHDIGNLGLFATEGLVEKLALEAAELDIVGADIRLYFHFAASETRLVVRLKDGDAGIVDELDTGDDALARRHQDDEIIFLGDEVLEVRELGCDVATVSVDE